MDAKTSKPSDLSVGFEVFIFYSLTAGTFVLYLTIKKGKRWLICAEI